jgi:hypothetical protein
MGFWREQNALTGSRGTGRKIYNFFTTFYTLFTPAFVIFKVSLIARQHTNAHQDDAQTTGTRMQSG